VVPLNPGKPKESQCCPNSTGETRLYGSQLRPGFATNRPLTSRGELGAIHIAGDAGEIPQISGLCLFGQDQKAQSHAAALCQTARWNNQISAKS
jgi:hypothetical protein